MGEPLATATVEFGKPRTAIFREVPGYQWRKSSGLVVTVLTDPSGCITLIDETAAPPDQPVGRANEGAREIGYTFNLSSHVNVFLEAPGTLCKGNFGADCWEYQYDNDLRIRADFAASGAADGLLREVTLGKQSLMQQLHLDP
ncbi:MAG: hypothetical protein WBG27_13110 [Candidatus Aquilonibacter sp.]